MSVEEVLKLIFEKQVVRKSEIEDSETLRKLLDEGLIKLVFPIGEAAYVITQKGIRFLQAKSF